MGCSAKTFAIASASNAPAGSLPGTAYGKNTRYLVVSDSPEKMTGTLFGTSNHVTLYECSISLNAGSHDFRVFVWALNNYGSSLWAKLLASVSTGTATLSSGQYQDDAATDVRGMGNCLAQVQLFGTFDGSINSGSDLTLTTTEQVLWGRSFSNNQVVGALIQFTVNSSSAFTLNLRTMCANSSGDVTASTVVGADSHIRGWWPYSKIKMDMPAYDVAPMHPGEPEPAYYQHCAAGKAEAQAFASQGTTLDPNGTAAGNNGLYGVDLYYEYQFTNSGGQAYPGYIAEQAMDTGAEYHGAAWPTANDSTYQGYTDQLLATTDGMANITSGLAYSIPAGTTSGSPVVIELVFANGGAATLPFATVLSKIGYTFESGGG